MTDATSSPTTLPGPRPLFGALLSIALRTAVVIGLDQLFQALGPVLLPDDEMGIGTQLLYVATLVGLVVVWGLVDGLRFGVGRLAVVWIVTGLLTATVSVVLLNVSGGVVDGDGLRFDLRELTGFLAGVVAVPALLAGGVAALLDGRPHHPAHDAQRSLVS